MGGRGGGLGLWDHPGKDWMAREGKELTTALAKDSELVPAEAISDVARKA